MHDHDDALRRVLDEDPAATSAEGGAAVRRARRDVDRIVRGLALLAREAPGPARRRRPPAWLAAAAAIALVAGVAAAAFGSGDDSSPVATPPVDTETPPPAIQSRGLERTLTERVAEAQRIVIGTVTAVETGTLDPDGAALDYVLATVDVDEALKPPGEVSDVVAFDYAMGGATSSGAAGAPWSVGDRILLFLVSDAGTVSETLQPPHLQVAGGDSGRYRVVDDELDAAPFTLDDVREAARG